MRHGTCCFFADITIFFYDLTRHAHLHFEFGAVCDYTSYEIFRAAGIICDPARQQPCVKCFLYRQPLITGREILTHHTLQRILIDAEDMMPENLARSRLHLRYLLLSQLARFTLCRNAYIDRVRLGISGYSRIVAMNQPAQPLFKSGFSQTPDTHDTREDQAARVRPPPSADPSFPHPHHLP